VSEHANILVVTVGGGEALYEDGLDAIQKLKRGASLDDPATLSFANEQQLSDVFNAHTYKLLRVVRDEHPESIRATARLVDRDVKNVHQELTTLEALGVVRFEDDGNARRPVFPFDDLYISPFRPDRGSASAMT
jgi:predicted transcriptional regulator